MPETVICTFLVKPGAEADFTALLSDHWPALHRAGLVTDFAPLRLRGVDPNGKLVFVEIFEWKDSEAASTAHEHRDIGPIWRRMEPLVEDRGGQRKWQFPHYERLDLEAG